MKVVQCEYCGKIRLPSGKWVWVVAPLPDVIGTCKPCGEAKLRLDKARLLRDEAETRAKAAKTYGPAPEGTDVFAGFREER